MILHATALSGYCAKVRLVLCVKQVDFEEREPPGGYRSQAYRDIVPMGTVPALQIDQFVLSESEVINEFLEECFPQPAMLPLEPQLRARVRFLSRFHDLYLEPAVRTLFAHTRPTDRRPAHVAETRTTIARRLAQLVQWTQPQPYLLTPTISLADCGYLVTVPLARDLLEACGQPLELPAGLQRWLNAAAGNPAVDKALAPWRAATDAWLITRST